MLPRTSQCLFLALTAALLIILGTFGIFTAEASSFRIIVSDIVLYNPEKFEAALRDGNPLEALDAELDEGRAHFRERIPERVRERRDFLGEELVRVARLRGMK